jgi:hypothetical protein
MANSHDDLLLDNRVELVEKIKLDSVLWDHLLQRKIVTREDKELIQVGNRIVNFAQ